MTRASPFCRILVRCHHFDRFVDALLTTLLQGISIRPFPSCENAGGKLGQKRSVTAGKKFTKPGNDLIEIPCTCRGYEVGPRLGESCHAPDLRNLSSTLQIIIVDHHISIHLGVRLNYPTPSFDNSSSQQCTYRCVNFLIVDFTNPQIVSPPR